MKLRYSLLLILVTCFVFFSFNVCYAISDIEAYLMALELGSHEWNPNQVLNAPDREYTDLDGNTVPSPGVLPVLTYQASQTILNIINTYGENGNFNFDYTVSSVGNVSTADASLLGLLLGSSVFDDRETGIQHDLHAQLSIDPDTGLVTLTLDCTDISELGLVWKIVALKHGERRI